MLSKCLLMQLGASWQKPPDLKSADPSACIMSPEAEVSRGLRGGVRGGREGGTPHGGWSGKGTARRTSGLACCMGIYQERPKRESAKCNVSYVWLVVRAGTRGV